MKLLNIRTIAIAFLLVVTIFFFQIDLVLAGQVQSNSADNAREAGEQVVEDMAVKQKFGKTANGDRLLNRAREKANENLNDLADKVDSNEELPESKQLFLDNLQGNS